MGFPRNRIITDAQRKAMPNPPVGVLFWISDIGIYAVFNGNKWDEVKKTQLWDILMFQNFEDGVMPPGITVVNDSENGWYVGTAESYDGLYGLYVSNDGGVTAAYSNDNVCHFYFDITLPANIQKWRLRSMWKCMGEINYDFGRVYVDNTASFVPTAGNLPAESSTLYRIGNAQYNNQTDWQESSIEQDNTEAGNTIRIIVSFRSDISVIYNPPLCLDNFYVETLS